MTNTETLKEAMRLLKSIGCPQPILEALDCFEMFVHDDEIKQNKWYNLSAVEGEWEEVVRKID